MKKKYLDLYYEWMEKGMSTSGLCGYFDQDPAGYEYKFPAEFRLIYDSVPRHLVGGYWGAENPTDLFQCSVFTPLRQNIVLLMAAMNGEL